MDISTINSEPHFKRARIDNSSLNPYLVGPILHRLLKQIEKVVELKELRKICKLWDEFGLNELEDRAYQGRLKAIDLSWTRQYIHNSGNLKNGQKRIFQFLEDTGSIPQIFRSFKFIFPDSLKLLHHFAFSAFFCNYSPMFVELNTQRYNGRKVELLERLLKDFLRWMDEDLRNLIIVDIENGHLLKGLIPNPIQFQQRFLKFPNLTKLTLKKCQISYTRDIIEDIILKEYARNLTSFVTNKPLEYLNLPRNGLSTWSNLTHLDIHCKERYDSFVFGLTMDLVSMSRLGMRLKKFHLKCGIGSNPQYAEDSPNFLKICKNIGKFLKIQAKSLEELVMECLFLPILPEGVEYEACRIHLPKFESLLYVKLDICGWRKIDTNLMYFQILELGDFSAHFPQLVHLNAKFGRQGILVDFFKDLRSEPKKRIKILTLGISDTEDLRADILKVFEILTPCLEKLIIHKEPKLLIADEASEDETSDDETPDEWDAKEDLHYFEQISKLNLTCIHFSGFRISDSAKEELKSFFPCPVEFNDIDWKEKPILTDSDTD